MRQYRRRLNALELSAKQFPIYHIKGDAPIAEALTVQLRQSRHPISHGWLLEQKNKENISTIVSKKALLFDKRCKQLIDPVLLQKRESEKSPGDQKDHSTVCTASGNQ